MSAFLLAVALWVAAFVLHFVVWRVRVPKNHLRGLLAIFILVPSAGAIVLGTAHGAFRGQAVSLGDLLAIALFYLGATGCYLIVYTGIEDTSPSLVLIRTLERAADRGCTREELAALITADGFVLPRLKGLAREGLVTPGGQARRLTARGFRVARFAAFLAFLFNLDESV